MPGPPIRIARPRTPTRRLVRSQPAALRTPRAVLRRNSPYAARHFVPAVAASHSMTSTPSGSTLASRQVRTLGHGPRNDFGLHAAGALPPRRLRSTGASGQRPGAAGGQSASGSQLHCRDRVSHKLNALPRPRRARVAPPKTIARTRASLARVRRRLPGSRQSLQVRQ